MVDILPQRWAGSQGRGDAAMPRIHFLLPLCHEKQKQKLRSSENPEKQEER